MGTDKTDESPAIAEEIRLESDQRPLEERIEKVRYINRELRQEVRSKGIADRFAVFNDTFLYVSQKKNGKSIRRFQISLAYLDEDPKGKKMVAVGWLKAAIALLLLAQVMLFTPWQDFFPLIGSIHLVVGTGMITLAVILFMAMLYTSYNKLIFHTEGGGVPLVYLYRNRPDKKTFAEFRDYLGEQIRYAHQTASQMGDVRRASLMRVHRHLRDEGVIDANLYDKAKQRLLGLEKSESH